MKLLLSLLCLTLSTAAFAAPAAIPCSANPEQGVGIDPDYVAAEIAKAKSCGEASDIAAACAAGSSMDSLIAGSASQFCDKETGRLGKADISLKKLMTARCVKVCDPRNDGTMCISRISFCSLDVARFFNSVNARE